MKRLLFVAMVCAFFIIPEFALAAGAGNQPRDWIAAPHGTVAGLLYYNMTSGHDLYTEGNRAMDADLSSGAGMFRAVAYFPVAGLTADVNVLLPFGDMELDAGGAEQNASGLGDPALIGTLWLVDNPVDKRYWAVAQYVFFPVGDYQNDGAFTLGNNRWQFKTATNFTQGFEVWQNHDLYLEAGLGVDFYGDNDDYGANHETLEKDSTYTLDAHISLDLTKDWWISADYCGVWGGEESYADVNQNELDTQSIGGSVSYMLTPSTNILLQYSKDVYVRNGIASDNLLIRVSHAIDYTALFE